MTDSELRALMKSNLNAGAKELYQQYYRYVYAIVFRLLRDCGTQEDVEDCVADTFAEILSHADNIRGENLKAYIGRAAHNKALNYCRSLNRQEKYTTPLNDAPEPVGEDLESDAEKRELKEKLLAEIQNLGEPDSTILVQKFYFGRSMAEIAEVVGLTTHAAQVRCGRALKRLKKTLKDWR